MQSPTSTQDSAGDAGSGADSAGSGSAPPFVFVALIAVVWAASYFEVFPHGAALATSVTLVAGAVILGLRSGWLDKHLTGRLVRLGAPVVAAMITQNAVNLVDTAVVGHLPAEIALPGVAALGLSLPVFWLVGGSLSSSISVGTQAITARRHAQGNDADAGRTLMSAATFAVVLGLVFTAVGYFILPDVLPFFNADPSVIEQGIPFARVRFLGIISMVVTAVYKAFFDGIGKTQVHMWAAIVMNVANIYLCYGLVFGELGLPRLEVAGAAWAASVSSFIGTLVMIGWSLQPSMVRRFELYRFGSVSWSTAKSILRLSLPSGGAVVIGMTGFLLFLKAAAAVDEAAGTGIPVNASATAVILQIVLLIVLISLAFGTATATLVSQSLGAKDARLAARFAWESVKFGTLIMAGLSSVLFIFPHEMLGLFMRSAEISEAGKTLAIEAGSTPLRLMAAASTMIAAAFVFTQSLYGAGNTKFVMIVELILHMGCLVPLSWLFGVYLGGGLLGVWAAAAAYIVLLALIMGWKFAEGSWKHISL